MVELRVASISDPLLGAPRSLPLVLQLVARGQTMGFLPAGGAQIELSRDYLEELVRRLRLEGIAALPTARLLEVTRGDDIDDDDLLGALRATIAAIDASPRPEGEWGPARELLGDEQLAGMTRISESSLRRYASGERRTPDDTAWRLHVIARLLASLVGSFNEYGMRRWFERPRRALEGATPAEVLERAESEEDEQLEQVIELADQLLGAANAT
jgi:hypothetical protein